MKVIRVLTYVLVVLLFVAALFAIWYRAEFSMGVASAYELNDPTLERRVLIATQESEYKHALVDAVVKQIKDLPVYIRVIDVSELDGADPAIWNAIVILHTWEMGEPEEHSRKFVQRAPARKLVVVTTSGSGEAKLVDVDGISSASKLERTEWMANMIVNRIQILLNN
jgi:hypothetical protein